jgi:hypothetical protein
MTLQLSSLVVPPSSVIGAGTLSGNLLGSTRLPGTTYTNSTGRPLVVYILGFGATGTVNIYINSIHILNLYSRGGCFIVPIGATYSAVEYESTIASWYEY